MGAACTRASGVNGWARSVNARSQLRGGERCAHMRREYGLESTTFSLSSVIFCRGLALPSPTGTGESAFRVSAAFRKVVDIWLLLTSLRPRAQHASRGGAHARLCINDAGMHDLGSFVTVVWHSSLSLSLSRGSRSLSLREIGDTFFGTSVFGCNS